MIVRDEAHIITRCLESVRTYIDHWIVCDTGSIDDTCVKTRAFFKDAKIPGKLLHHKWQDFGYNRTLALYEAAKSGCEYTLVIDADEVLVVDDPECLRTLEHDAYRVEMRFPTISYPRVNIMRSARNFRYVGVIHEYATCTPPAPEFMLDPAKIHMWTDGDGARGRSGNKLERDLVIMQKSVEDEPNNPRYWFYLAQGYETNKRVGEAIAAYRKRSEMGDYQEEVWYSHYRMGALCELSNVWTAAVTHYLDAYACDAKRAEALYRLGVGYHNRQLDHMALLFLEGAVVIDKPVSAVFVEPGVYDYGRWVHYAICLHNTGQAEDARVIAGKVIASGKAPAEYLPALQRILEEGVAV
jgi:glycosyltransferase involved in cell wall biosynthesis